ncbi:MAG: hypothetical protein P9M11_04305 [Candidatus Tenebribacter burtonii]|jgi:TRAP-type mannitol/chloroaromatic compound transport system permease small subunit|nr:hypothetical protein [Candidatus Tenebribacter burtonii]
MKEFKEEIEKRRQVRRNMRSSTWINLIIRILALIFVVMIIRYFSDANPEKFRSWITSTKTDSIPVQENR